MKKYGVARRPQAGEVFTDREEPRETLRSLFARLYRRQVRGESGHEPPLVCFYGVGGVGKTSLLHQSLAEFADEHRHDTDRGWIHLAMLDLHGQSMGKNLPGPELLWLLRNALRHQQIATPLFDCVYLLYWAEDHPGQSLEVPKSKTEDFVDAGVELIDELMDSVGILKCASRLWEKAVLEKRRTQVSGRWAGINPAGWSQQEKRERMGELLWMDLKNALENSPLLRLGLLIDEFERIQSTTMKDGDAQSTIADLLGGLFQDESEALRNRFCAVIMGREALRWSELDDPSWQPLIESHLLGGLTTEDAGAFLDEKAARWFEKNEQAEIAGTIRKYKQEILAITNSGAASKQTEHLPFHLDLVIEAVCVNPRSFSPAQLAKGTHQLNRLEDRFLRYLKGQDEQLLKALQVLSLAISFDRELFDFLIRERCIIGYAAHEFPSLVGDDHSYVRPHPTLSGHHLFHSQMQTSLVSSMTRVAEVKAGAVEVLNKILDYRTQAAQFETPTQCTAVKLNAYMLGIEMLQSDLGELLSADEVLDRAFELGKSFDSRLQLRLQIPICEWLCEFAQTRLGKEHLKTLTAIRKRALLLHSDGSFNTVKDLLEFVLAERQRQLGEDHPLAIATMGDLARAIMELGDIDRALELQQQVVAAWQRTKGDDSTLIALNNLAAFFRVKGDLDEARRIMEYVLPAKRRVYGEEHPATIMAMATLALTLRQQGHLADAKVLAEQVLDLRRRQFGNEHLRTLQGMNILASILSEQNDLAGARRLHEESLETRIRTRGEDNIHTLRAMSWLATTLRKQGDHYGACKLLEKALAAAGRRFGDEHPLPVEMKTKLASWQ